MEERKVEPWKGRKEGLNRGQVFRKRHAKEKARNTGKAISWNGQKEGGKNERT